MLVSIILVKKAKTQLPQTYKLCRITNVLAHPCGTHRLLNIGEEGYVLTSPDDMTMITKLKSAVAYGGDGGGGFFLSCEDFGTMFDNSFPACAFFFFFFAFFLKWKLARAN